MQKVKIYKCPHCGAKYKSLQTWGNHVRDIHQELMPSGWSYARYFYFILTGKSHGTCVVCKKDTMWNEATKKYERFCSDPKCKEEYRNMFRSRMMNKYGKVHLLNDPEQQRKMLAGRKISGLYTFANGTQIGYVGSYEHHFLKMLDTFLKFDPNDLMMPSPHTYEYDYKNPNDIENEGKHFFIPDAYIPSLNLEIEIKQNTNMHPKLLKIDKVKELQKDALMESLPDVNYIKIVEKQYSEFFQLISELSDKINDRRPTPTLESDTNTLTCNDSYKLSDYKIARLDKLMVASYKNTCRAMSGLVVTDNSSGEIVVDKDSVVGFYHTEARDNCIWLKEFVLCNQYNNSSLVRKLFARAVRFGKITNLQIEIVNTEMIDLYRSYGFCEYARNNQFIFMMKQ